MGKILNGTILFILYWVWLVGIELLFFVVAGRGCFGFVLDDVDNSGMFQLLPSRAYRAKGFSASHLTPSVRRLGVHQEL